MKIKHVITTLALAGLLGAGAFAGLSAKNAQEAEAQVWRQNPTIYFVASDGWSDSSATFKMNYYDNATWKGKIDCVDTGDTYTDGRAIYSATVTDGAWVSAVQFLRMDSAGSTELNYSGTFDISDSYDNGTNLLCMDETTSFSDGWTTSTAGIEWVSTAEITVNFVLEDGTLGDELDYNVSNSQYEGVITLEAGDLFKVRKTVNETPTDYAVLDSYLSESVATSDGSWVTIVSAGTYMVYFKSDNTMWIETASGELVAYAYAGYFLTNVGCAYPDEPTGWSTVKARYESTAVTDDARDYIYDFDVSTAADGDDIAEMIERYNLACKNHTSLDRFIKDSNGNVRPISSNVVNSISSTNANYVPVIIIVSSIALVSVLGAALMIKRRKEDR